MLEDTSFVSRVTGRRFRLGGTDSCDLNGSANFKKGKEFMDMRCGHPLLDRDCHVYVLGTNRATILR